MLDTEINQSGWRNVGVQRHRLMLYAFTAYASQLPVCCWRWRRPHKGLIGEVNLKVGVVGTTKL